jgi:hypothetical protein
MKDEPTIVKPIFCDISVNYGSMGPSVKAMSWAGEE